MARPLRIEYSGAWYHVMNRGSGHRCVFPDDELRHAFLSLLGDVHERFNIQCHAYCLMGNHYHLLLHTPSARLGRAMRHVDGVYTQRHNRRRKTDGPLFRGRYKAQLIEEGDYLWIVSRYIHRNPIEAGFSSSPGEYPWSSYRYFTRERDAPAWLRCNATIRQFGSAAAYREFVEGYQPVPEIERDLLAEHNTERCPTILGSKEFVKHQLLTQSSDYEIPDSKPKPDASPETVIIDTLCAARGWQRKTLARGANKTQRQRRAMIMSAVTLHTPAKLAKVAAAFDLHYSTAATAISRLRKTAANNREMADEVQQLSALLKKNEKWADLTP